MGFIVVGEKVLDFGAEELGLFLEEESDVSQGYVFDFWWRRE